MFMTCSNSVLNPHSLPTVETENETALLGNLVHDICQEIVETGALNISALKQRLSEPDYDRASMLTSNFLTLWREASKYMTNPQTEGFFSVELSHATVTGHIDCYHLDPARAFILDYKTGRQHEDHYHQMAAYAYGVWAKADRPEKFTVYVSVVYLEDNSVKPYEFTPEILRKWEKEVAAQMMQVRYTVGRKCAFCTIQDSCPAYRVFATNAMQAIQNNTEDTVPSWASLSAEEKGEIVDTMYVLNKGLDRVRLSLRNHVASKGPMDLGAGKEYVILKQEEKQLDLAKALPVLEKRIGKGNIASLSRMPLDSALTAFAVKAAKGQKTRARNELFQELDAAGAIVRVSTEKLWRRPINEQKLEVSK